MKLNIKTLASYLPQVVGVVLILGGIVSTGLVLTDHFKSEAVRDDLLSQVSSKEVVLDRTTSATDETTQISQSGDDVLIDEGELSLKSDQKVVEVKEGTQVLEIPDLEIKVPVLEGTGYDILEVAAGHFKNTGEIGKGNYCIAGHSISNYACIFDNLHEVKLDIPVYLYDSAGDKYTYYVTDWQTVKPDDTWVLNDYGDNRVTIITCDDKGKTRLVVTAIKMTEEEHNQYLLNQALDKRMELKDLCYDYASLGIAEFQELRVKPKAINVLFFGDAFRAKTCEGSVVADKLLRK